LFHAAAVQIAERVPSGLQSPAYWSYTVLLTVGDMYATDDIGLLWNSLPRSITDINSHVVLKKKLKCYLSENMSL